MVSDLGHGEIWLALRNYMFGIFGRSERGRLKYILEEKVGLPRYLNSNWENCFHTLLLR